MTDLMIHVESIVRPVRATQARKLRMRHELLAHLQSAYDEERARDPEGALPRAQQRLGHPAHLAAQLQQSVPTLERLLLARLPAPRAVNQWESRSARLWGSAHPLTLSHAFLLLAAATVLPYAALLLLSLRAGRPSTYLHALIDRPLSVLLYNAIFVAVTLLLCFSAARFITAISHSRRRILLHGSTVVTLLTATLLTCVLGLAGRALTPADLAALAILAAVLLLTLTLTGRLLARLQSSYTPWLSIDLAD